MSTDHDDQLSFLFDAHDDTSSCGTLRAKYERFHKDNPWVMDELARLALRMRRHGVNHYGIAALFEVLRYRHTMRTTDTETPFKLSNSYRAFYSRHLMRLYPELDGFFDIRPSVADKEEM